jgi:hypothetical protein
VVTVVVGVVLTALLGGLLVPIVKDRLDRRTERFRSSLKLIDDLADCLWAYWKAALRIAYYGRQGAPGAAGHTEALRRWDGDESWDRGTQIQILLSRSRRLLRPGTYEGLAVAQQQVVDSLDQKVDRLRQGATPGDWEQFYRSLMSERRASIDTILAEVVADLRLK